MGKTVFQLKASGNCAFTDDKFAMRTRTVYSSETEAIKRMDKFRELCIDPKNIYAAEEKGLTIEIVPLELVE